MKNRRNPAPQHTTDPWLAKGKVKTYRRGQRIIEAGSSQGDWVAISRGAAYLVSQVAPGTRVAVAALWLGDVIGGESPLGKLAARYDVTALVDVTTINIPLGQLQPDAPPPLPAETHDELYTATASRLHGQISMRLAGNGLQRLVSVMATLATALAPDSGTWQADRLALPISQACIGQLSGLSRRQTWIYLGQLSERGWVATSRSKVTLEALAAWLALMAEVETSGIDCIGTLEQCDMTLQRLSARALGMA
ncbi:Crp/Fnr family transcriptional regulator [Roseateles sp. BYS78W]|uniref:Crp/Fnr family transcriptional regulator n=1 Tax=Pelomonas candidula TaxID=3299025 RepID=A0ABW7HBQ5_9BURK